MASRTLETEIDRLYQLPVEEFTPARNALAKSSAGDAARIRALHKPPIAAWAVNQLYWQHGDVWNELIAAAENARKAHRAVLAGRYRSGAGDGGGACRADLDNLCEGLRDHAENAQPRHRAGKRESRRQRIASVHTPSPCG